MAMVDEAMLHMRERMQNGKRIAAASGRIMGPPAYGYVADARRPGIHVVDPGTAAVVRTIFGLVASGTKPAAVARRLDGDGVSPPGRNGGTAGAWTARTVRSIVANPIYAGLVVWGRTRGGRDPVSGRRLPTVVVPESGWTVAPVENLAIVSEEVWRGALDALARDRRPSAA